MVVVKIGVSKSLANVMVLVVLPNTTLVSVFTAAAKLALLLLASVRVLSEVV